MTDHEALVRACLDEPEDNTRRLAYADWLDEQGSDRCRARAEWIRLTCSVNRKSIARRQAGEPAWLGANAHRIWPALASAAQGRLTVRPLVRPEMELWRSDTFVFRLPLLPNHRGLIDDPFPQPRNVLVWVGATRGVTRAVQVPFTRYAAVAPLIALDEPACPIACKIPRTAVGFLVPDNVYVVRKGAFAYAHLREVEQFFPGFDASNPNRPPFSSKNHDEIENEITKAMTAWARARATQGETA